MTRPLMYVTDGSYVPIASSSGMKNEEGLRLVASVYYHTNWTGVILAKYHGRTNPRTEVNTVDTNLMRIELGFQPTHT